MSLAIFPTKRAHIIMEFLSGDPLSVRLRNPAASFHRFPDTCASVDKSPPPWRHPRQKESFIETLKPDNGCRAGLRGAGGERVKISTLALRR